MDYFEDIFSSSNPSGMEFAVEGIDSFISLEMNNFLIGDVTVEEVKTAVMEFDPSKCPGPDGMTTAFYQKNWDLVGEVVFKAV